MTRRFVRGIQDTDGCLQIREICGDGKCSQISQSDLDRRLAVERRHDAGVVKSDRRRVLDGLAAELGGLCSACGDPIGAEVAICPVCRQPQAITGQRNQAKRKRIGWKNRSKAADSH